MTTLDLIVSLSFAGILVSGAFIWAREIAAEVMS